MFDHCDLLLVASVDKDRVPPAMRESLDSLGVLLARDTDRIDAVRLAKRTTTTTTTNDDGGAYVGAVAVGASESSMTARCWWSTERTAATRLHVCARGTFA